MAANLLPPVPLQFRLPRFWGLFAFGAAYLMKKPTLTAPDFLENQRILKAQSERALARLDIADPVRDQALPSPEAFALAEICTPGGREILMQVLEEEAARYHQAVQSLMRRQQLVIHLGQSFVAVWGGLGIYFISCVVTLIFQVKDPDVVLMLIITCLLLTLYLALAAHRFFYEVTKKALSSTLPLLYTPDMDRSDAWIVSINPKVRQEEARETKQSLVSEPTSSWDFRLWT